MGAASRLASLFVVPEVWTRQRDAPSRARRYLDRYLLTLRSVDTLAVIFAVLCAQFVRFGGEKPPLSGFALVDYTGVSAALTVSWVTVLHLVHAYDGRLVGHGVQEYSKMLRGSVWLFAALSITAYAFQLDVARGYVLVAFPLGTAILLLGRWLSRRWLIRRRREGLLCDQVLLVGDRDHVAGLASALGRAPGAGYHVVGACVDGGTGTAAGVPVLGTEAEVLGRAIELGVDVIAVSSSADLGPDGLRRLGWALEGTGIDLVVAPGIMEVAGPRVLTRPVEGLPLMHVESPSFSGPRLTLKNMMDRIAALLLLLLLSPVVLGVAWWVWLDDRGPVLFRQVRVGQDGRTFGMWKFRSMVVDAEKRVSSLMSFNEAAGPLFKVRKDPRVTRAGRVIRKYSLDELPQLFNVLSGDMSLVGPRPPLPREVAEYELATRRRLLVKPGLTGLWQISGRSDLSWEEAVRLDLYYVENWSPLLDFLILLRTVGVVLRPRSNGAY
ncbi:sugar transferase [Ornithinimicrobium avium]|uniref:Sugar transferase n=1 Tax=Ornithinimicrobium avium TaxID=2283195 RepID=A0A345NSN0_9MICO|nr:sugar transferase [Ornithinimicrobium avium]AXH98038.1 sugar transferase [Ornithinimicrobium avium]